MEWGTKRSLNDLGKKIFRVYFQDTDGGSNEKLYSAPNAAMLMEMLLRFWKREVVESIWKIEEV